MIDELDTALRNKIFRSGEKIEKFREHVKHNNDELVQRITKLENQMAILECGATGHEYTKWQRITQGWTDRTFIVGTCGCGHQIHKVPQLLKPAEKKRFLDMGLVNKYDFPAKKKK
jgi:hypothetical protein